VLDVLDGQGTSLGAGAIGSQFGFTGREWDADAHLYYYRARWYGQEKVTATKFGGSAKRR